MSKITVAVCDDEITIRKYYQNVIENDEDLEFAGSASNISECKALLADVKPDILLLDLQLEHYEAGFMILSAAGTISPKTKIIILTMHDTDTNLFRSLENGASYFLTKTISDTELVSCIKSRYYCVEHEKSKLENRILEGGINLTNENKSLLYFITMLKNLTKSEIEVLKDLCDGLSYRQISEKRFVTENTVRSQIVRMSQKMNCKNIRELIKITKELKITKYFE